MTNRLTPTPWINQLRQTSVPSELAVLALKTLGVQDEVLQEIYGVDVQVAVQTALEQGRDSAMPAELTDRHDCDPLGMVALRNLLATPSGTGIRHQRLQAAWEFTDKTYTLVWRNGEPSYEPLPEPRWHAQSSPERDQWSREVRQLFLHKGSNLELLLLLPLPCDHASAGRWHVLRSEAIESGQSGALRLLAGLSILGLSHHNNLNRTDFLPKLVTACAELFSEVGVSQSKGLDRPTDEQLGKQTADGTRGLLLFRQQTQGAPVARPFVVNFARAWQNHPNRITKWKLRDRTGDADEMADALLLPFTLASGVCLHLSLTARTSDEAVEHKVHLLGPDPWIEFLSQGHGEMRGKERFEPFRDVERPDAQLLHIDAPDPAKYTKDPEKYIKEQMKLAKVIRKTQKPKP